MSRSFSWQTFSEWAGCDAVCFVRCRISQMHGLRCLRFPMFGVFLCFSTCRISCTADRCLSLVVWRHFCTILLKCKALWQGLCCKRVHTHSNVYLHTHYRHIHKPTSPKHPLFFIVIIVMDYWLSSLWWSYALNLCTCVILIHTFIHLFPCIFHL